MKQRFFACFLLGETGVSKEDNKMNRIEDVTNYIKEYDDEVGKALELELGRQRRNLELIASENIVSPAVMLAMGTVPTNKYAEGYPGKRYYG